MMLWMWVVVLCFFLHEHSLDGPGPSIVIGCDVLCGLKSPKAILMLSTGESGIEPLVFL